jgi:hypothetical protein
MVGKMPHVEAPGARQSAAINSKNNRSTPVIDRRETTYSRYAAAAQ